MAIFNSFLYVYQRVLHIQFLSESTDPQKNGEVLGFLQGGEERPERPQVKALDPQGQCRGDISRLLNLPGIPLGN